MRGAAFLEAVWGVLGEVVLLASVLLAASSIECLTKKLGCTVLEIAVTRL